MDRLMRKKEVVHLCGVSYSSIWRMMKRGEFPKSRQVSGRVVVWLQSEVEEWLEAVKKAA